MKKFVLIDQSITGEGGHYLPYARSVLDAAAQEDYTPVLVTNRRFSGQNQSYAVHPLFAYTTGESLLDYRIWKDGGQQSLPRFLWGGCVKPVLKRVVRRVLGGRVSSVKQAVHGDTIAGAEQTYKAACFARDFADALRETAVTGEDAVFIPSISTVELNGLAQALNRPELGDAPTVHLLFRRNVFSGRREDYGAELPALQAMQAAFAACQALYGQGRLRFYTDTEELTAQYEMLSGFSFTTLPIPHTAHGKSTAWRQKQHRTAVYLGDARIEKGYLHLPELVEGLTGETVDFQIQSNFSVPGGEGGIAACRAQLENIPSVTLYEQPLSPAEYASVLRQADVLLILYDAQPYYARSSGVFAEAMSAGIPAIIPADTWMSREVCRGRNRLADKMIQEYEMRRIPLQYRGKMLTWKRKKDNTSRFVILIQTGWSNSASSVKVVLSQLDALGSEMETTTRFVEGDNCSYLDITLQNNCDSLRIELHGTYGWPLFPVADVSIIALKANAPRCGLICAIFDDVPTIPERIKQVLHDYQCYKESAEEFAKIWTEFHNAKVLIDLLKDNSEQHQ